MTALQAVGTMVLLFGAILVGLGAWAWIMDRRHPS